MVHYPLTMDDETNEEYVKCNSPKWPLNGTLEKEQVKMDISLNGYDYSGDFTFTFYEVLDLFRIAPMAGPNEGKTNVRLYGTGFTSTKDDTYDKWGILNTTKINKEAVSDYYYYDSEFT